LFAEKRIIFSVPVLDYFGFPFGFDQRVMCAR